MPRRAKKPATKVKPPKIRTNTSTKPEPEVLPFHLTFPITLVLKKEHKNCYFQCEYHLNSYLKKRNLKKADYVVQPTAPKAET